MVNPLTTKKVHRRPRRVVFSRKNIKQNLAELPETTRTTMSRQSKKERAKTLEDGLRYRVTRSR